MEGDPAARPHTEGPGPLGFLAAELSAVRPTLQAMLDNVDQGILMVDRDGRILVCNRRTIQLLGLPEDVLGADPHFHDLTDFQQKTNEFEHSTASFRRRVAIGKGLEDAPPVYERVRPDGSALEIRTMRLSDGGYVRTYTDITERLQREQALRAAEAEYRSLFENAVVGIYRTTSDGRQLRANPALCRLNGYRSEADLVAAVGDIAREWYVQPERRGEFLRQMLENGRVTDFVSEVYAHGTRQRMWVSETAWTVPGPNGEVLFEGTVINATERKRAEAQIAHIAHHDALTGLPNRILFSEEMRSALAQPGDGFAVLCLDLDRFKEVNDTLGHGAGDALLREAGLRLRSCVRASDIVARLGGDEFAVIQRDVCDPGRVHGLATRLVEALSRPYAIAGQRVIVGVSVGVAIAPEHGGDAETLLQHADIALYRAKEAGRQTFRFFEPAMVVSLLERRTLEMELRCALSRDELFLEYQPIVDAATRRPIAFEALLRWRNPARGLVAPGDFIPIAEDTGLMVPIGEWVLRESCREAGALPGGACVSVNLSPAQFRGPHVVGTVRRALADSGLAPERLMLEITESVLLMDDAPTLATLRELRALGVQIALDDFGIGHSSLSYLQRFPFDRIKLDRSFIASLGTEATNAAIVRAVIALGRDLGIAVVAEGVEREEQFAALVAEGCPEVQGYLFGRPGEAHDVLRASAAPRRRDVALAS